MSALGLVSDEYVGSEYWPVRGQNPDVRPLEDANERRTELSWQTSQQNCPLSSHRLGSFHR